MLRTKSLVCAMAVIASCAVTAGAARHASAAYTALYGSDGNDFYQFTGSSAIAGLKSSGWNGLLMFAVSVQSNGDITYGGHTLATGGSYVGDPNWGNNVAALKTPPTTVYRYEVCIGGWGDGSFTNIKNLIASQGTGTGSILYKNFLALKNAVPGIDAINYDDEQTYDVGSSTSFGQMLNGLGYKVSLAPYTNQNYWVQVKHNLGSGCDLVYLQCYSGGAGNNPNTWNAAFGGGFHCMSGLESNDHSSGPSFWASRTSNGDTGGFYWPDVSWGPGSNWGPFEIFAGIGLPNFTNGATVLQLANMNSGLLLNAATASNGNPATGDAINQWVNVNDNQIWTMHCIQPNANPGSAVWSLSYYTNSSQTVSTIAQAQGGGYRLWPYYAGGSQLFTLAPASSWPGCYTVTFADGFLMDDQWGGTSVGTPVQEWPWNGSNSQVWQPRFNPQTGY